ncbi:MAG: DUF2461 domain-containing protein [Pedobacter sp.]|nr:DUF2461 domain-containing protein [Pedobacter sp.]MDQ8053019.1 DUF2461 domain-containing protein [Pedobacter sp.]
MLSKSTFQFIGDLAQNNNREWFAEHKGQYEAARAEVLELVGQLIKAVAEIDPLIAGDTDPKKSLLRIYRDVRFSKNKDPYKKNFGIWFSARSKGGNEPGYYINIQPGNSFVAGGYWMPEAPHLKLIRQEIDYNIGDFLAIVADREFAKEFKLGTENALKNAPKGYDPDDPNIAYLKLKSFEALKKLDDAEFLTPTIVNKLKSSFQKIYPLVAFLRNAIDG